MIDKLNASQTNDVIDIWYAANLRNNNFISSVYWFEKKEIFKATTLLNSETYVYYEDGKVLGFISIIDGSFIDSIEVRDEYETRGIYELLFDYVKSNYSYLTITVFKKNESKVKLCMENNFEKHMIKIDEETKEEEIVFVWER